MWLSHTLRVYTIRRPGANLGADEVNASAGGRGISCTLGRFTVVAQIPVIIQPLHDLLHLTIPVGPKDNQATNDTGTHQSDGETNPETPQFHVVLKSKVDAQWDTNDIIGTNGREYRM